LREVGKRIERQNLVVTEAALERIRSEYGEAAFASRPSLGRIEAAEKAWRGIKSAADWRLGKVALRERMRADGLLLAPTVSTRVVTQRLAVGKWVDVRNVEDEESEE
jgi:hypothetical protein